LINCGPVAQIWTTKEKQRVYQLGICDGTGILEFNEDKSISKVYNRGSAVGLSSEKKLKVYFELS
jgi:hypothetical protein